MEIKFKESACPHLHRVVDQLQVREQTQEVRLPDAMPDIGRVLGCWGQTVIRSKEWRGDSMSVSGGVLAWVLYEPEDGSEERSVETWIPFQLKWDFPEAERDGTVWICPYLKNIDARSTSARKLMVRSNVSAWGSAWEQVNATIYEPEEVPEDVQLLRRKYPLELPMEAGEKLVELEEAVTLPPSLPEVEKIMRYELNVTIPEQRILASRLVFRGTARLHLLYRSGEKLCALDQEFPFSQYAQLDRDFSPNAWARITPVVTELEVSKNDGQLLLKAGVAAQYVLSDRVMVELVEDAYSLTREMEEHKEKLSLPALLDQMEMELRAEEKMPWNAGAVVDVCWLPEHPQVQQGENEAQLTICGQFQVLYYDENGALQCNAKHWEQAVKQGADQDTFVKGFIFWDAIPRADDRGQELELSMPLRLRKQVAAQQDWEILTGLELGQQRETDSAKPSLILCRCEDGGLWEMAKCCGSTVDAICRVNGLEAEPESGRMLLIPVG